MAATSARTTSKARTNGKTLEHRRLEEARTGEVAWKAWGPYLSERQWGTVREDYSAGGDAWSYLPHDHARSRASLSRFCSAVSLKNGATGWVFDMAYSSPNKRYGFSNIASGTYC